MVDVDVARRKLVEALGGCSEKYWSNMKLWYRQKISKDDFDSQAFEFLGPGKINYHNEFIISILAKCEMIAYSTPKTIHLRGWYGQHSNHNTKSEDQDSSSCAQDLVLPDSSSIHGRLFLCAWDVGLESISENCASNVVHAVETILRNILSACVARRKACELREGSHFPHRYGHAESKSDILNERLRRKSSLKWQQHLTYDQAEALAHTRIACGTSQPTVKAPISLFNLRDALLESPQVIPSLSLRLTTMERIANSTWHPSKEESRQNKMYILDTRTVHEKIKQQRASRTEFLKV